MLRLMSDRVAPEGDVIDVGPRKSRRWRILVLVALAVAFLSFSRVLAVYLSALWFGSLGYSAVYWYIFKLKLELFLVFFVLTAAIVRGGLWLVGRAFSSFSMGPRTIFINQQPVSISPGRFLRPIAWVVAIVAGLIF